MKPLYFAFSAVLIVLFVFGLIWLWQKQPNIKSQVQTIPQDQKEKAGREPQADNLLNSPKNNSIQTEAKIKFQGKTNAGSLIAIFSNSTAKIAKADENGNFESEFTLINGLNLINTAVISTDFKKAETKLLTLLKSQNSKAASLVYAGSVKTIFDTHLTISTANGQIEIKTAKTTDIIVPQDEDEKESTRSALKSIRIGDFLIATGENSQNNEFAAKTIEIIRENKPQNTAELALAAILASPRQNSFSAKNLEDEKIIEFTLKKNSQILADGNEAESKNITKDKKAIVIFHDENDKKIIDLIYLLP